MASNAQIIAAYHKYSKINSQERIMKRSNRQKEIESEILSIHPINDPYFLDSTRKLEMEWAHLETTNIAEDAYTKGNATKDQTDLLFSLNLI